MLPRGPLVTGTRSAIPIGRCLHSAPTASRRANVLDLLEARGLVKEVAGDREKLRRVLGGQQSIAAYSGIDPTAPSLHVGHLLPLNVLFWLFLHGHRGVSLLGDATARIGDPTDRLHARAVQGRDQRDRNAASMATQLEGLWKNISAMTAERVQLPESSASTVERNSRWLDRLTITDYLSTVGQCGKIGAMLSRDTVKNRLEKGQSMSLAEFNYPLIQAYDWWHMFSESRVQLQIGGSDQYGNIVAGIDLIKHMTKQTSRQKASDKPTLDAFGLTTPLLTTSTGEKFGKSAGNAIWLDPELTKPFDLYGYLMKTADADVQRFLELLTLVPQQEIKDTMAAHLIDPKKRKAQRLLASELCRLAHGEAWAARTAAKHEKSRGSTLQELLSASSGTIKPVPRSLFGLSSLRHLALYAGLAKSASKATALAKSGGLYHACPDGSGTLVFTPLKPQADSRVEPGDLLVDGRYVVLRSGKWRVAILQVKDDHEFRENERVLGVDDWKARVRELSQQRQS